MPRGSIRNSVMIAAILSVLVSCSRQEVEPDIVQEMDEMYRIHTHEVASWNQLIWLDLIAEESKNTQLAERLADTKRILLDRSNSQPFAVSALLVDDSYINLDFLDEANVVRKIRLLDASGQKIAEAALPKEFSDIYREPEIYRGQWFPWRTFIISIRVVAEEPRNEFVNHNRLEIRSNPANITFVEFEDENGNTVGPIPVVPL